MKYAPVVFALAFLLSGCDQPLSVASLAADPSRLHTLRAQCRTGAHDGAFCAQVAQADLRRFLRPDRAERVSDAADLPPIPPSFDEPADADAPGQEDSP